VGVTATPKTGFLAIAEGGTISLLTANAPVINISGSTITSTTGTASTIKAVGGTVTLGDGKIKGLVIDTESPTAASGVSLWLAAGTPQINVTGALELEEITIGLTAARLVIPAASNTVKMVKSKLILDTKTPIPYAGRRLGGVATISGIGAEVMGAADKDTTTLISLADNTVNPVIITGAPATLTKGVALRK
jgi:hypothetical protein